MARRIAREIALHLLFESCFQEMETEDLLKQVVALQESSDLGEEYEPYIKPISDNDKEYIEAVVRGVLEEKEQLDELIKKHVKNWNYERVSYVCTCLLRIALYETQHIEDVPESAAINEAVELAKRYESIEAGTFINGILGAISRDEKTE